MVEVLLWFKALLLSPLFWGFGFVAMAIPQFFIAQRLHHHQPWYAFVPVLKCLQWFQMGRVPTIHLLALIPLLALYWLPMEGPDNLQLVFQTIKVALGLQIGLYLLFFWFRAARVITVRAGERESHALWLLIPLVNILVLARFALKKTFWVATKKEKSLIDKILQGVEGDHKISTLKKYAVTHGFNKSEFEMVSDKALTVKNHHLTVVTDEAAWVHYINYGIGALFAVFVLWAAFTLLSYFSVIFSKPEAAPTLEVATMVKPNIEEIVPEVVEPKPAVKVRNTLPDKFIFIMEVQQYEAAADSIEYSGRLRKGGAISRDAQRFYLLDKNFDLLDSVRVQSVSGLFGQFAVTTSPIDQPEKVAYIAETEALRAENTLGTTGEKPLDNQSLLIITDHDGASTSQNRELIVNVKHDRLAKSEVIYAYDRRLKIINTAEIIYLLNPQKSSVDEINPTDGVELVLEFEKEYTGEAIFLSPLPSLKSLADYLKLMVS